MTEETWDTWRKRNLPDDFWNAAEESTYEYLDTSPHFPYLPDPQKNSKLYRWLRGLGLGGGLVSTLIDRPYLHM